jgi:hypothetical protein
MQTVNRRDSLIGLCAIAGAIGCSGASPTASKQDFRLRPSARAECTRSPAREHPSGLVLLAHCNHEGGNVPLDEVALWVGFRNQSKSTSFWIPQALRPCEAIEIDIRSEHGHEFGIAKIYNTRGVLPYMLLPPGESFGEWADVGEVIFPAPDAGTRLEAVARYHTPSRGAEPTPPGIDPVPVALVSAPVHIRIVE